MGAPGLARLANPLPATPPPLMKATDSMTHLSQPVPPPPPPEPPDFWANLLDVLPGGTTNTSSVGPQPRLPVGHPDRRRAPWQRRSHRSNLKPGNRVHAFRPTETACAVCLATRPWPEAAETIIFGHAACEEHAHQLRVFRTLDAVVTQIRVGS